MAAHVWAPHKRPGKVIPTLQINVAGSRSNSSARHWAGFLVLRMFRTCDMCHMCIFSKAQCIFYNSWLVLQKLPLHVAGRIWTHLCASGRLRRCIDPCRWWRAQCCNLQETRRGTARHGGEVPRLAFSIEPAITARQLKKFTGYSENFWNQNVRS